jgi:predicted dehydrogenase
LEETMAVRFGVVGSGYWAEQVHLSALREHAGVELVGLWGRDRARTEATARTLDTRPFVSLDDMLSAVDAVSFSIPPAVQATLAPRVARAGKHLLLEKPLALEPAAAQAVVDAVEGAPVAALVFFTRRFVPPFEQSVQALAARGPWAQARTRIHSGAMHPGTPFAGSIWRQEKGALWDIGPHALSVLLPIMGAVSEVRATQDEERLTTVSLRHASGAASETTLTLHAAPADVGQSYRFTSARGEAVLDAPSIQPRAAYGEAITELLHAIAAPSPRPHRCGVRFAYEVVGILAAAERALGSGEWQPVP